MNALVILSAETAATPGGLSDTARELLGIARRLGEVDVLWLGTAASVPDGLAPTCHIELPTDLPRGAAVAAAVAELGAFDWVIMRSHPDASDAAAAIGHATGKAVIVDATGIDVDDEGALVRTAAFGSTWDVTTRIRTPGAVLTFRPNPTGGAAEVAGDAAGKADPQPLTIQGPSGVRVLSRERAATSSDLESAAVVVAGGRGTDGDFSAVEDLADSLGGVVGSTRDVTDLGWIGVETMIGQSGARIAPAIYVAAGISGAVHHVMGIRGSGVIVAVNVDEDAPIFAEADFGIVGDQYSVLTQAAEEIRRRRAGQ